MQDSQLKFYLSHLNRDIPAGVVVFLVALPLCLGLALSSDAPPFAGIISGVVGGLVVAVASGSQLSVSGPSASFLLIMVAAIQGAGFESLLLSTVIAGVIQLAAGFIGAGSIAAYFPSAVIKGMLTAIGIIVILKQLPYALGYNPDANDDLLFLETNNFPLLHRIWLAIESFSPGVVLVCLSSIAIMILWNSKAIKSNKILSLVPGALIAVIFSAILQLLAARFAPGLSLSPTQLVKLPLLQNPADLIAELTLPAFGRWLQPDVYVTAASLALVAGLETLLSLEAADKLDPHKRIAPPNRELMAQGLGNICCGLLGGLPLAAVIVRTSANVNAGAVTKIACVTHGVLLLLSAIFLARLLNLVPLGAFAAVLLMTGYSLAKPSMFVAMYRKGSRHFFPFAITILSILAFDMMKGVAIGIVSGIFFVLREHYGSALDLKVDGDNYHLTFKKDISFINKAPLRKLLSRVEPGSRIVIDGSSAGLIDEDITEMLEDFARSAADDGTAVEFKGLSITPSPA
jgi:MFS superfamily sulfate permease-like transporter